MDRKHGARAPARRLLIVLALLSLSLVSPLAAGEIPWEWKDVPRIVAIGDIHGAYESFVAVLRRAGLVDADRRWTGGRTHLVQLGDVVDRGPDSRKAMDLLIDLEEQARHAGGRVHVLIGNHEAMNLVGLLDYVSRSEFDDFRDSRSERLRDRVFELHYERQRKEADAEGKRPLVELRARQLFYAKYPLGYFELQGALGPKGRYGRWILQHNTAVRINGIVFSHGDWSEELSTLGIAEVNHRVREELSGRSPLEDGVTFHRKSPLQYRGLARVPLEQAALAHHRSTVERILINLGATRMVVGHTVTGGIIEPRFGGKHLSVDVGMLEIYRGGHEVALEIEGDALRALHPLGDVPLPDRHDEASFLEYVTAVAEVDPRNVGAHLRLAQHYRARSNWVAARDALEKLFRIPKPVPLGSYLLAGDVYTKLGAAEKASEHYLTHLHGLAEAVDPASDDTAAVLRLARFSLEHRLELETALRLTRLALEHHQDSESLEATLARLETARAAVPEAVLELHP